MPEQEETWMLYLELIQPNRTEHIEFELPRIDLTFGNLVTMKSRLGYSVRDFLYYKERCGNGIAKHSAIENELQAAAMVTTTEDEREIRLVLTKEQISDPNVAITPIKIPPGTTFYEDFLDEPIDEYKDWLEELHDNGVGGGKLLHSCP